jgi:hypothetical protein
VTLFFGPSLNLRPVFFQFDWLKQKRDRHVGFMDRAKRLEPFALRGPGPGLGVQGLGPLFDASSSNAKKKDRCLWLGNGLSYAQRVPSEWTQQP